MARGLMQKATSPANDRLVCESCVGGPPTKNSDANADSLMRKNMLLAQQANLAKCGGVPHTATI